MHKRILEMLIGRYDQRIMNNVQRGDYVECMIATALRRGLAAHNRRRLGLGGLGLRARGVRGQAGDQAVSSTAKLGPRVR